MGKEMRKYHEILELAVKLSEDGRLSWKEAIEKAKDKILVGQASNEDKELKNKNTLL